MIRNKLSGKNITRWLVLGLRILVGAVFAFSGFVKAIDPWGVLYKFEEYIVALGCDWLSPFLLFAAFALSIFEFVLGIMLIVGAYRRITVLLSLLLMLFMTPLTLWVATSGTVADCGCFGEAVKLNNWATFVKNVLLLTAIIFLLRHNIKLSNLYSPSIQWIITCITTAYIFIVAFYGYFYQPMIDFRPYKTGKSIILNEEYIDDNSIKFAYQNNGITKIFNIDEIPSEEDTAWTFVERIEPRPHNDANNEMRGITISENGIDVTDEVLKNEGEQIILVFPDMSKIDITYTYLINVIDDFARKHKVDIIGLTGAGDDEVEEWNDMSMATYPIYKADDTILKTLARGNPSIVYLKNGIIVWKRTLQSISEVRVETALKDGSDFTWIGADYNEGKRLETFSISYLTLMILVLILNRSYRVYKFSTRLIKKNRK